MGTDGTSLSGENVRQAGDSVNSWVVRGQSSAMGAERLHFFGGRSGHGGRVGICELKH